MIYVIILLLNILFTNQSDAAFNQEIMTGARPMAMGGAFTGIADDANAVSINSAGLSQLEDAELLLGYSKLFIGLDYGNISRMFLSGVYPIQKILNLGLCYNRLNVNNYSESMVMMAVSRKLSWTFSFGLNFKFLSWNSDPVKLYDLGDIEEDLNGSGFGVDFTGLIRINNDLKLGFVFSDINQPDISSEVSAVKEKVPYSLKLGLAYSINKWLICSDFIFRNFSFSQNNPQNREIFKKLGVEYPFFNYRLYARAGFSFYDIFKGFNLSAGAGYLMSRSFNCKINYAFVMPFLSIKSTYGTHYLTVGYKF